MMSLRRPVFLIAFFWVLCFIAQAQHRRDPLAPVEIDQLRDQAQEPNLRLKLFVEFARRRLDAIERDRSDPKITDRGRATRDGIQDFLDVYDELNDNVDTFENEKADFRKGLKIIIDAEVEFQAKLRALQASANQNKDEVRIYEFLLQSALDTLDRSAKDHRALMIEQEEAAKHKKKSSHKE